MNTTEASYRALRQGLLAQITAISKDGDAAQDILHDTFVKLAENAPDSDGRPIAPWLRAVARNAALDHLRRSKREVQLPVEPLATQIADLREPQVLEPLARWLASRIERLPDKYRAAMRLTELEGKSQAEAALALGLSYSGLKSRVQRGREKLRQDLLRCCAVELDHRGAPLDYRAREHCNSSCC